MNDQSQYKSVCKLPAVFVFGIMFNCDLLSCLRTTSFTSKRAVSPNPYLDNPVNGYACPSGVALHYDDVPINGTVSFHVSSSHDALPVSQALLILSLCLSKHYIIRY